MGKIRRKNFLFPLRFNRMSNNNLNVLAGKLEKIHISNQPTTYKTRGLPAGKEPVVRFAKKATLKVKRSPRVRGKTMKTSRRQEYFSKKRKESTMRLAKHKRAEATAAKRKAAEEAAMKSMISGKTRAQAKKVKEEMAQMKNE